jgi:hypothetical protein
MVGGWVDGEAAWLRGSQPRKNLCHSLSVKVFAHKPTFSPNQFQANLSVRRLDSHCTDFEPRSRDRNRQQKDLNHVESHRVPELLCPPCVKGTWPATLPQALSIRRDALVQRGTAHGEREPASIKRLSPNASSATHSAWLKRRCQSNKSPQSQ